MVFIAFDAPGNVDDAEEPARESEDTEGLGRPGTLAPTLLLHCSA